jgi:hypothetical protein
MSSVAVPSSSASISSSLNMLAASSITSRRSSASTFSDAGMSPSMICSPLSPSKRKARIFTRSITPSSLSSRPIGICIMTALCLSFSRSCSVTRAGLAPERSHLLTKAMRGTL